MTVPVLRPYQQAAIDAVVAARKRGVRRMVVCLPTGAGKTVIFARIAALAHRPVLVLAHREELLQQACDKIARALGPDGGLVAVEQGALRAPREARVVVASLRSLHENRLEHVLQGRDFGLIVYDECHHATADDNQRVLRRLGAFDPQWTGTLLGFTATTARGDGQGLDAVFEDIVYTRTLPEMVNDGYLVPLRGYRVATAADLRGLSGEGQDFAVEPLAEAIDVEERNALVARSIQELARDRRTIAFCVTVAHARNLCRSLNALGVPAGLVHGEMRSTDRAKALAEFRSGRVHVITNVGVLTEGFDDPGVSCIAMARPTRSEGLYAQCVGRGTRLAPDKQDCLVLDFVDLSALSLCTLPSLYGLPRELDLQGGEAEEARQVWQAIGFDKPGFELEAGAITLSEIQERAALFDPLTRQVDAEVRALSNNAWISLGSRGLLLHFQPKPGQLALVTILAKGARGRRWLVSMQGRAAGRQGETGARFSTLEEAVQAVDWEIDQLGQGAASSALPEGKWRHLAVSAELAASLLALRPPREAKRLGEAMGYLATAEVFAATVLPGQERPPGRPGPLR